MKDQKSIDRLLLLHPKAREPFTTFITNAENDLGVVLRIAQGMRTFPEQQAIYDQGRTTPGKIVSNAKPGSSFHNYGLAIDLVQIINGVANWDFDYKQLIGYMPPGVKWGGSFRTFKDLPHFEMGFGLTWRQLLEKYDAGNFIPGTKFVNI